MTDRGRKEPAAKGKRGGSRLRGKEPLGSPVPVKIEPSLKAAIQDLADLEERSLSAMIRILAKSEMKRRGLWSPRHEPGPQMASPDEEPEG
jgi:hypothetical protein